MTETDAERRTAFIQGLRDLADFLTAHPTVPTPRYTTLNAFVQKAEVVGAAKATGGWEKIYNQNWFYLRKTFPGGIEFDVTVEREQICRKVATGTTTLPAQPEREVEAFTWVCDEPLLAPEAVAHG